jgi:hypothetical protein
MSATTAFAALTNIAALTNTVRCSAQVLVAVMAAHGSAMAGEITLYSHPTFGGREVTLREATPNLSEAGFNDRASSMVIRSGRWELCVDAEFRGECSVYERGEYKSLAGLNNRITSAREVGSEREHLDWRHHYGRSGLIELFAQPGLKGNSTVVLRDNADFVQIGFNDRAASMRVEQGIWQLCSDANYRASCRTFTPGRYDDLGAALNYKVSSARMVQPEEEIDPPQAVDPQAAVLLYSEEGMRGRVLPLRGDAGDFVVLGFNDAASSLLIRSGTWEFCVDSRFRGSCRILGAGAYRTLDPVLVRSISSARMVAPPGGPGRPEGDIELFSAPDFSGARLPLKRDVRSLTELDFNDRAGSVIVHTGQWEFCRHKDFGGQCLAVGPGRYAHLGALHNAISSLRRLH